MAIIRVRDFGKAMLNTDVAETLLQPGEWSRLENIDIESGDIRSAWGDSLIDANPPITPRYLFVFEGDSGTYLIISDGTRVYAYDGSVWIDITPSATPVVDVTWANGADIGNTWGGAGTTTWGEAQTGGSPGTFAGVVTFTVFLGTLVVGCSEGVPTYWPGEVGRLLALPGWDAAWRAEQIVAFTNHLVAISFADGIVAGDKYRVAWSSAAAEGEIPQSWTPTAENLAGSVQLRDSDGYLTVAAVLRDNLIIYKQDSIYRMYLRGDAFVMGVERVVSDRGCDSSNGVTSLGDVHYFADRGDLRIFNGQATQSVAALRIKEALASAISNEFRDRTYVVAYPERDQVHVGVVPAGETAIAEVLIFNTVHNAWTRKKYPGVLSMTLGPFSATVVVGARTWGDQGGTRWRDSEDSWGGSAIEPTEDGIIFGGITALFRADKTNTDYQGNPKECVAERRGLVFADINHNVTIKALYPEIEGQAEVGVELGYQWRVGDLIRWTSRWMFTPGVDKKIPLRVTGMPVAIRITSQSTMSWRLSALSYEIIPASRR